jgi:hypothetical protein
MKKIIILIIAANILVIGCASRQTDIKPDFSTPEKSFETSFLAAKFNNNQVSLSGMSEKYRLNFGATREEQLANLITYGKKVPYRPTWKRQVKKVEYGPDHTTASVFYDDYLKGELQFRNAIMPMIKEDGEWRVGEVPGESDKKSNSNSVILGTRNLFYG